MHNGCPANLSLSTQSDCIEARLKRVAANNTARPLFAPTYGVETFADVALEMLKRLPQEEWEVVGVRLDAESIYRILYITNNISKYPVGWARSRVNDQAETDTGFSVSVTTIS